MTESVARHYDTHPLVTGLTHTAHPVSLAAAVATIDVMKDERLVERAARLDRTLAERLAAIAARHAIVGDVRSLGLYGVIELVKDRDTREPLAVKDFARKALERGIHVATRFNYVFVAPPLCIEEGDLSWGLDVIDALLSELRPSS